MSTGMSSSRTIAMLAVLATLIAGAVLVVYGCGGGGGGGASITSPTPPDTTGTPPDSTGGPPPPTPPSFDLPFAPGLGVSKTYTFNAPGDWAYFCLKHGTQGMRATVFVRESSLRDSALVQVGAAPTGIRYAPDTVTVKVGGTVRWVNVSTDPDHTATRL
jgi:plastocyanin